MNIAEIQDAGTKTRIYLNYWKPLSLDKGVSRGKVR